MSTVTVSVDLAHLDNVGDTGTIYFRLARVVTLSDNTTLYPSTYSAAVTAGIASVTLSATSDAISGQNAPYVVEYQPASGARVTLGRIVVTASGVPLNLSDLLEVAGVAQVVNRAVVGASNIAVFENIAALQATSNRANRDLAFVLDSGWFRCNVDGGETASGLMVVVDADSNRWYVEQPSVRTYDRTFDVRLYGALADDATDNTTVFATVSTAAALVGGTVVFPRGTYRGVLVPQAGVTYDFMGSTLKPPATSSTAIISLAGTAGTSYTATGSAARGDKSVATTTTPSEIAAGDLVVLRDATTRFADAEADINMEVHLVSGVSGSTITFRDYVRLPKTGTVTIYKITPVQNVTIRNVALAALTGTTTNIGILADMARNLRIENVGMTNGVGPGITFRRSYKCAVVNARFASPQSTGSGQGYGVQACRGSAGCTFDQVYTQDMRIAIDFGGCIDTVATDCHDEGATITAFAMSHNGLDADNSLIRCTTRGAVQYGIHASAQAIDTSSQAAIHGLIAYGFQVIDCDIHVNDANGVHGCYFAAPLKGFRIRNLRVRCGTGLVKSTGTSTVGLRFLAVDCDGDVDGYTSQGFRAGVSLSETAAYAQTNDHERIRLRGIRVEHCVHGIYYTFGYALYVDDATIHNVDAASTGYALFTAYSGSTAFLRYLTLRNFRVTGATAGSIILWDVDAPPTSGILGVIDNIHTDLTVVTNLSLGAGWALTLEQMLTNKNGELLRVTAAGAVTSAADAFPAGIVEGQRLTMINVSGNDIIIQHSGTRVINAGAASVTLNATVRAATWVWSGTLWFQVA